MNLFFLLYTLLLNVAEVDDFYSLEFNKLDGTVVKTSSFEGKKVIIAVVSANSAGQNLAIHLDSVQQSASDMQVIIVPTDEFSGNINPSDLGAMKRNLSLIVTQPAKVTKSGAGQHPLFAWLTSVNGNKHFDMDVEKEGQVFLISGKGRLYGVFPPETPRAELDKIINQPVD